MHSHGGRGSSSGSKGPESVTQSLLSQMEDPPRLSPRKSDLLVLLLSLCLLGGSTALGGLGDLNGDEPLPCTAGYGLREMMDNLLDDSEDCNLLNGEVPFINNTCIKLLEQGPCASGQWVVIDPVEEMVTCEFRQCPEGMVMFRGSCHSLDLEYNPCPPTFELVINQHGKGACECPPGHIYYARTQQCYVPYTRGPCEPGYIIKVKVYDEGGIGQCERNPCPREKMTPLDRNCLPRDDTWFANCHTIGQMAPCRDGSYLLVDHALSMPFCLPFKPNSVTGPRPRRNAPCFVGHINRCARKCNNLKYYRYRGMRCAYPYKYFFNNGRPPVCVWNKCRLTDF